MTFTVKEPQTLNQTVKFTAKYDTARAVESLQGYVHAPIIGETLSYDLYDSKDSYFTEIVGWYENGELLDSDFVCEAGKSYTVRVKMTMAPAYYLASTDNCLYYVYFDGTRVGGRNYTAGVNIIEHNVETGVAIFEVSMQARREQESADLTITAPSGGALPSYDLVVGDDVKITTSIYAWEVKVDAINWAAMGENALFEIGKTYRLIVKFEDKDGYFFDRSGFDVTVNGQTAKMYNEFYNYLYYVEFTITKASTKYDVTVNNGTVKAGGVEIEEINGGTIVTLIADEMDGKIFRYWQVVSGDNVVIADRTLKEISFCMPACDVEITAVYEDIITLSEIHVTVTAPLPGAYYDGSLTSAEPDKYTVTLQKTKVSGEKSQLLFASDFDVSNPYVSGKYYYYAFTIELVGDTYAIDSQTKIYLNGVQALRDSNTGYYYGNIETPYAITVENGVADTTPEGNSTLNYVCKGQTFYVIADPAEEGYVFSHWEIVGSVSSYGDVHSSIMSVKLYKESVTIIAHYSRVYTITVNGGTAGKYEAGAGDQIRLWADPAPANGVFSHWLLNGERIELVGGTHFVMPDEDAVLEAVYHVHTYNGEFTYNDNLHWYQCADGDDCINISGSMKEREQHTFDHACDTTCNDGCGYVRAIAHNFATEWMYDEAEHWYVCTVEGCDAIDSDETHSYEDGVCTACGYECAHVGGTATCSTLAQCTACSAFYGTFDATNHESDGDNDHACDGCGETTSICVDTDAKDHVCDICGATDMGTHEQAIGKHTCDYCGETMSTCVDTDAKDHVCDICGATLGTNEDNTTNNTEDNKADNTTDNAEISFFARLLAALRTAFARLAKWFKEMFR